MKNFIKDYGTVIFIVVLGLTLGFLCLAALINWFASIDMGGPVKGKDLLIVMGILIATQFMLSLRSE